jgi:Leucine-rich repeat (LRR) protein
MFGSLERLYKLHLDNNKIKTIENDSFINLKSLQGMNLSYNQIENYDDLITKLIFRSVNTVEIIIT